MRRLHFFISILLIIALPVSGFASGVNGCSGHLSAPAGAARHHHGAPPTAIRGMKITHLQQHLALGNHHEHKPSRDTDCHCAGALALPSHVQATFDNHLSSNFAVIEQFPNGDAHRGTPYRPPIRTSA
ncbi:MAG: hypothetical protein HYX63_15325 [Gammaproteobacteria bacterium]|nr:hypothetical protein [Gammaproteobacteria bacterium]